MGLGQKEEIAYGSEHVLWRFLPHITTAFRPKGSALYVGGCGCRVEDEKIACMMQAVGSMMPWLATRRKQYHQSKQAANEKRCRLRNMYDNFI